MELTINGQVYEFKFGIGFIKRVNGTAQTLVDGMPGMKEDVGLAYMITKVMNGDAIALADMLLAANAGFTPRVTMNALEDYIDDEGTDIDALFDEVLDFLSKANATKRTYAAIKKAAELTENE